jgi:hypothetical protein
MINVDTSRRNIVLHGATFVAAAGASTMAGNAIASTDANN